MRARIQPVIVSLASVSIGIAIIALSAALLVGVVFAATGGDYSVTSYTTAATGDAASGGGYQARSMLTTSTGQSACGTYDATIGLYTGLCGSPVCGNGVVEYGEECDRGDDNGNSCPDWCSNSCTERTCTSSGSSGGGGGGGGLGNVVATKEETIDPGKVEASFVRSISSQKEGEVRFSVRNVAITSMLLEFGDFAEYARINVQQYAARPVGTPDVGRVYKFIGIEHSGLESVQRRVLTFTVPKAWLAEQQAAPAHVVLLRSETRGWVPYGTTLKQETETSYEFTCEVPGFSFFAIAVTDVPQTAPVVQATPNTTNTTNATALGDGIGVAPAAAPAAAAPPAAEPVPPPAAADVEMPADSGSGMLLWIIGGIVLAIIVGVGVLFARKRNVKPLDKTDVQLAQAGQQVSQSAQQSMQSGSSGVLQAAVQPVAQRPPEHDPTRIVYDYIIQMRASGASESDIRARLLAVGWDPLIVDMELMKK
jgi:PGF-pre-PGF domain-containing protein